MRIVRVLRDGKEEYGYIKNGNYYNVEIWKRNDIGIENFFNENIKVEGIQYKLDENIKFLAPIRRPGKIICIGRNYLKHSEEQGKTAETKPLLFSKYSTSITHHLAQIPYPNHTKFLDYEVELAVIIGKRASKIDEDEALEYVFGYTVANDITARDVQKSEKQWTRGKAFDNSLPLGPAIITRDEIEDPQNLEIWLTVNGDKRQLSNTKNMIFSIKYLISYISQQITLEPGDILLTGTPEGVGYYMEPKGTLNKGDHVACGVEKVGELRFDIV